MSTLDLSTPIEHDLDSPESGPKPNNILDNYELVNGNYTKGIQISQCTLKGTGNFSVWEFSGYEPYRLFYDHFIGDQNCIHMVVYNLNQGQDECFDECVYWLEYLRSRIIASKPRLQVGAGSYTPAQRSATPSRDG